MQSHKWRVLIVEDEADSLEFMQMIFEHYGIASTGVQSAEEAILVLNRLNPGMIVVDLALPEMDGWGFLQHLQLSPALKDIPRVAITAFHTPVLAAKAIAAGFDAFFPKPIDAMSFVQELTTIVEERRAYRRG